MSGPYTSLTDVTQYYLPQQNVGQTASNLANAFTTTISYGAIGGGYLGGYGIPSNIQQLAQTSLFPQIAAEPVKAAKAVKKYAKGILNRLRSEIDDWHGDILERITA